MCIASIADQLHEIIISTECIWLAVKFSGVSLQQSFSCCSKSGLVFFVCSELRNDELAGVLNSRESARVRLPARSQKYIYCGRIHIMPEWTLFDLMNFALFFFFFSSPFFSSAIFSLAWASYIRAAAHRYKQWLLFHALAIIVGFVYALQCNAPYGRELV